MPVTFATDLRDLKDFNYVPQVPLDALFKNMGYKQAKYDQTSTQLQRQTNSLLVDALGQDVAIRDTLLKQVNDELTKFAGADLTDPAVANQISGFIGKVSQAPELLAAQSRHDSYNQMVKEKKDQELKGNIWINEGLEKAIDYYNSGQFDPDVRFRSTGFAAPDLDKSLEAIAKATPEFEKWVSTGAYDDHYKEKSFDTLYKNYMQAFTSDPKLARYYDYLYRKENPEAQLDSFFNDHGRLLSGLIPNLPQSEQMRAIGQLNQLQAVANSPAGKAAARSYLKDLWFKNQAYEAADTKHYISQIDRKANDFAKMKVDHEYKLAEQENQAWLNSGAMVDDQGNHIINPTENRDLFVPEKYTVRGKDGTTKQVTMDPNLAGYYKVVSGKDPSYIVSNAAGQPEKVDLSIKSWLGMGAETKKSLGKGWSQINDPTFILPILEKVSTTKDGITTSSKNLAYDENGKPAIYMKDGRIVYGLASSGTKDPRQMEFREISDENAYYRALYNSSSYKQADKKILAASKAQGNIFTSGNAAPTGAQAPVTYANIRSMLLNGDTIQAGVRDGKWYNIKTNQPIQ